MQNMIPELAHEYPKMKFLIIDVDNFYDLVVREEVCVFPTMKLFVFAYHQGTITGSEPDDVRRALKLLSTTHDPNFLDGISTAPGWWVGDWPPFWWEIVKPE
eukprot:Selendium_serpulae@DN5552_c0_g1_i3.p2